MENVARRLIEASFRDVEQPWTSNRILSAFRAGHLAYNLVPNTMPLTLFTLRLPIVDPDNRGDYLSEGDRAFEAFKLNRAWYSWVEHGKPPELEELRFYTQMRQEFAA